MEAQTKVNLEWSSPPLTSGNVTCPLEVIILIMLI